MSFDDELREVYDLARRALCCQAELGHREIIFESHNNDYPVALAKNKEVKSTADYFAEMAAQASGPGHQDQVSLLDDEPSSAVPSEFAGLDDHCRAICNCTLCPLGQTRTKFVYGVGNPHADIMFVGEAPGRDEDLKGEPFVGRAGKLLDKILEAMGLTRQDVYIANILKCRPPDNRDPQPDEMNTCMPYLKEQIRLIKPKFICALGRIAAHGLLDTTAPLGKLRGQWHRFEGIPLIVTYHPAALLRFQQYKRPTWEDMQTLMAEYGRINKNG
jgi:uracil-DNA glycosylase family 4